MPIGRQGRAARWLLAAWTGFFLTTAEAGWARSSHARSHATQEGCHNGFFQTAPPNFAPFFIATVFFFLFFLTPRSFVQSGILT